jgi:WD40 repeat protein
MANPAARTFISYSWQDGADAAARLRRDLEAKGFSIWQDLVALEGGRDWWSQIEGALKSKALQHFVLVVTPRALASPVVRREIRVARTEGKTFLPVRGPGVSDLNELPRWVGQLTDLAIPEHEVALQRILEGPSNAKRVPMMVPEPPADLVARPREFEALKAQLLDAKGDAVAITAALRGAGGYGKTTLAKALAHDPDIQDAYLDGVLWVELGQQGGDRITTLINDVVALLTGTSPQTTTLEAARTALGEALGDLRILFVIDDVWKRAHLEPFLHRGRHTTRLVTTRFEKELPDVAIRQRVDAMQAGEALALLSHGLPEDQAYSQRRQLADLAKKLHEWAQLLKLANGFLRDRSVKFRQPLGSAVAEAGKRLAARGLPAFDDPKAKDYEGRHESVAAVIGLNLDLLDPDKRARFGELGIFPEDADVPVGIVERLWRETGDLDDFATIDLLSELFGLSLLVDLDLERRTIRLHDTTRQFLQDEARKADQLAIQHKRLVTAMEGVGGPKEMEIVAADYFYRYLPEHLYEAGDRPALDAKLADPGWLKTKLATTHSPLALVADYQKYGRGRLQDLIGRTLRLTTSICARDERQLLPQLIGRLMACSDPAAVDFLADARRRLSLPTILTQRPSLTPPGAEVARLEGHTRRVTALAQLADDRLASGSSDKTIRLWDVKSGAEVGRLEGHAGGVVALAQLADGRLASGSSDRTIRLWDLKGSAEVARLEGHTRPVTALAQLDDGRLASGSEDRTIRFWDVKSGTEVARLEGHTRPVTALAQLADSRLASGSTDNSILLWDVKNAAEVNRLEGHTDTVEALAQLADGRLASGSSDRTIRLWDLRGGTEVARLEGHAGGVVALLQLADGRLASGSSDRTIRLWDLRGGAEVAQLEGHTHWAMALAQLADGRLASGSEDRTIRLWDLRGGVEVAQLKGNTHWVVVLAQLAGGCLASGSSDRTIRLWDVKSGAEVARLEGHTGPVTAVAQLADGRLASGSSDRTIRLWDVKSGVEIARLEGQAGGVEALAQLADGRLASGSQDKTIRLWDVRSGAELVRLEGHAGGVVSLAQLADGRLASGSSDRTIRMWDLKGGVEVAQLRGNTHWVVALAQLADGRLASGSLDRTIRLWDVKSGAEVARLEGHTRPVTALAQLADGRLASGSEDRTIRLWDVKRSTEIACLEVDAPVWCLAAAVDGGLIAGDHIGRLHWLEIVE